MSQSKLMALLVTAYDTKRAIDNPGKKAFDAFVITSMVIVTYIRCRRFSRAHATSKASAFANNNIFGSFIIDVIMEFAKILPDFVKEKKIYQKLILL